jgi:tRNA 2-thiouridine synthesizing protein A
VSEPHPSARRVDARGRRCPLPVIDLARAVRDTEADGGVDGGVDVVEVLADDPAAATDIPAWCRMRGHTYLGSRGPDDSGVTTYTVRVS